ncbi:hypothetical protein HOY82DRAFT_586762 [Tuber indicum]|nr:hypothetical protein HOY82DRAFT_586762 [Tuber indicum]
MSYTVLAGTTEYDYIICGGGTAGSVVAARLAESRDISVLLIEAGQHNSLLENSHMNRCSKLFDTDTDWNIVTEPNLGLGGRQVKATRGKFLGGSSGCNGTLSIRGTKQDYDDWELPGWSGDDVWRCIEKAENYHPSDWMKHSPEVHGTSGPLDTEPYPLAPISNMVMDSFVSKGILLDPDMFSTGDNPHGCGHIVRTTYQGLRVTAANYLLGTGDNLTLKTETLVDSVVFDRNIGGEVQATGVKVIESDGKMHKLTARREIIISGGAYCSPAILLRSGVGPKAELEKLGVEVVVDSPGVGKNLMDHLIVLIFYEVNKPGLTLDNQLYPPGALETSYKLWKEHKKGPLSSFPFGACAYTRLDERLSDSALWKSAPRLPGRDPMGLTSKQPNIELFTTECYGGPKHSFADFPHDGRSCFSIIPELFGPRSRGSVRLRSRDPRVNPVVEHNYLSDELDLEVLAEACRLSNEIVMDGSGTRDAISGSWPDSATHHKLRTRDDWKPFVKKNATSCYHPGGTCKMGKATDPLAVLDERLRVRGVKGLRVADTSVMPTLNQGHTQMAAYAIGERCAEIVKQGA